MDYSMKYYELTDIEEGKNLKKFNDDIKKEVKKQEKPKTKPQEIFVGFKKPQIKPRKKEVLDLIKCHQMGVTINFFLKCFIKNLFNDLLYFKSLNYYILLMCLIWHYSL